MMSSNTRRVVISRALKPTTKNFLNGPPVNPGSVHVLCKVVDAQPAPTSTATNVAAARRALAAYDKPLHVILGGSLKGEAFEPLCAAMDDNVRAVYLIGDAADELDAALRPTGVRIERCSDLARAVTCAAAEARPGEVVLLSPACASFDAFRDFEHRGEEFRRLAQNLEV